MAYGSCDPATSGCYNKEVLQMKSGRMSRSNWIVVLSAFIVALLLIAAWYPYTGPARQQHNMALAEKRLPRVQAMLDANLGFKAVNASTYTGQGGSIILSGQVETAEDMCRLMRAVGALRLDVPVAWSIKVAAEGD